jgi:cephalosporin hydroxylase
MNRARPGLLAEMLYEMNLHEPVSDINKDLWILRELASRVDSVVELGVRSGISTSAFLAGQPQLVISVDIAPCPNVDTLRLSRGRTEFHFILEDSMKVILPPRDLLFIDTYHTYNQLLGELRRHAPATTQYIALHDTISYGIRGEDESAPGLIGAYSTFLDENHGVWRQYMASFAQNGLTVLARVR